MSYTVKCKSCDREILRPHRRFPSLWESSWGGPALVPGGKCKCGVEYDLGDSGSFVRGEVLPVSEPVVSEALPDDGGDESFEATGASARLEALAKMKADYRKLQEDVGFQHTECANFVGIARTGLSKFLNKPEVGMSDDNLLKFEEFMSMKRGELESRSRALKEAGVEVDYSQVGIDSGEAE